MKIITCARELDLKNLIVKCERFLLDLYKKNTLLAFEIAAKFKLKALYGRSFWQICSNFDESIKENYFFKLSPATLFNLIANTIVPNRDESLLLKRCILWIYFNKDKLYDVRFILMILNEIDYAKVDLNVIHAIINDHSLIREIPECIKLFTHVLK